MSGIFTATLRFHLDQEEDRAALKYLQGAGRAAYGSYSKAVIAAVNDHFVRLERLGADPYLETREKEDAFLQRVQETIRQALQTSAAAGLNGLAALLRGAAPPASEPSPASDPEYAEDLSAAMEFIDSL